MLRIRRGFPYKRYVPPSRCGHRPLRKTGGFSRIPYGRDEKIRKSATPAGVPAGFALFSLQDIFYGRQLHFAQVADSAHELGTPGEKIVPVFQKCVLVQRGEAGNDIVYFRMA